MRGQDVHRLVYGPVVENERPDFAGFVGQLDHFGGPFVGHALFLGVVAAVAGAEDDAFRAGFRDPELILAELALLGDLGGRDLELGGAFVILGPGHGFKLLTLVGG